MKDFWQEYKREIIKGIATAITLAILIGGTIPWWWNPFTSFIRNLRVNYNDPSRIMDQSIFEVVNEINSRSTTIEKENYVRNYSGLRTKIEAGTIQNISAGESFIEVDIFSRRWDPDIFWHINCLFDKSYEQKFSVLRNKEIYFVGIVDNYNNIKNMLTLRKCIQLTK